MVNIKKKRGFTLVELIVVLVILAILAALLVPALTGYIDKARKRQVSDDEVILLARNVAKKIENELDYPGQIKVSVIRERRATEYAK